MTNVNPDPLNDLLRQWAGPHKPAEADLERLRQRVTQAVRSDAFLDLPPPIIRPRRRAWGWALSFALGAAAAAVVMVALVAPQVGSVMESDDPDATQP